MAPELPHGLQTPCLRRVLFLLLLLAVRWAQIGAVKVTNYSPWGECTAPPKTLVEKTGVRNPSTSPAPHTSSLCVERVKGETCPLLHLSASRDPASQRTGLVLSSVPRRHPVPMGPCASV